MNRIILPLDDLSWEDALPIIKATSGMVWGYKIRKVVLEMGIDIISEIKQYGNVMVDFKLYDIPSAMTESLKYHIQCGADITTVHCTAQYAPTPDVDSKKLAGVTILTSFGPEVFNYYDDSQSIEQLVEAMCLDCNVQQFGYLVCSPLELKRISGYGIKKITPGIRPEWYSPEDDQERVSTPANAIAAGADLLVIGRPILTAGNIITAIEQTNEEIESGIPENER